MTEFSVPTLSIAFMWLTAVVSIGFPLGLLGYMYFKSRAVLVPAIIGVGVYFLFSTPVQQIVNSLIIGGLGLQETLEANPFLYALYDSFLFALCVTIGTFFAIKAYGTEKTDAKSAMMFAIGFAGSESVWLAGIPQISAALRCQAFNQLGATAAVEGMTEADASATLESMRFIAELSSTTYLAGAFERVIALLVYIGVILIVWLAASNRATAFEAILSCLLLVVFALPARLYSLGVIGSYLVADLVLGLIAALIVFASYVAYHRHKRRSDKIFE